LISIVTVTVSDGFVIALAIPWTTSFYVV